LEQKLKAIRSLYPEYNIVYKIELDNDPAEFIVNTQKKDGFDLIVMGTHGRKGLGRLLMGSVAESVLRGATCPVLTIKHV
jgi:nucleotide-binding universal stress UspA family protein